ncbi:MAG: acyl-CoA dehydrogenase, partial [Coxiella burnetii]|nr:acyl-CoA dehydrogenase [Coxiella burnetii]
MGLLTRFRQQLPPISQIEREVLQAGDTWWEKQFFSGNPDWEQLFALKKPTLTQEEQAFIDNQTETLCQLINDWQLQQDGDLPATVWNYIKQEGFWGLIIAKKYGGREFSALAHSSIVTKIASRSIAAAITVMVPNSLGPAEFLSHYGTEEQKRYYLPRLAKGEEIGCFALTAVEAGSDATNIPDTGVVCRGNYNDQNVIGIRLNWDKCYITLAPIATLIAVAFQLSDPDHLLGDEENIGITVALIPADRPGIKRGARHKPLNLAFLNGPIRGKDVFIPFDFIPGGKPALGKGWGMMMECLSLGRGISLPGVATAGAQLSFLTSGAYAQIRHQFKRPIGDFEGIAFSLAQIGGITFLCEATRIFSAQAVDEGLHPSIASAIAKYYLTELGRKALNHAMDIHAGRGIQLGPRNYLGLVYQAVPISITVEGANILTRNLIIFGQGVLRCHPYLGKELIAAQKADPSEFNGLLLKHIGLFATNLCRLIFYGISGGRGIVIRRKTRLKNYLRQLTRMSCALNVVGDVTLLALGAELKLKESLTARLSDIVGYLYLASAVIKYDHDNAEPIDDWPFVKWSLDYCLSEIQRAFDELFRNFPKRWEGFLMRRLVFPWGRAYSPPNDQTTLAVADKMQHPSEVRDRLTRYCYIGNEKEAVGRLEKAFQEWQNVKPLWKKIHGMRGNLSTRIEATYQAGRLSSEERDKLQAFAVLYWDVLQVDEF